MLTAVHAPGWARSAETCIEKALLAWKSRWQAIGCIAELVELTTGAVAVGSEA